MTGEFTIAVHALVYLHHRGDTVSSETLAHNVCTNPARIRKVMARLKKAGLVETHEGPEGGYRFSADAQKLDLGAVCEATQTMLVHAKWRSGDINKDCLIASGMGDIMGGIYDALDQLCKERLARITIADIEKQIFGA